MTSADPRPRPGPREIPPSGTRPAPLPAGDGGRRWAMLAVLCVSLLIVSLDNTILNVALPVIVRDLHASSSQLQWIVDTYAVVFAGLLLVAGSVGDRVGRKKVFVVGLVLFAAGSAASAFSTTPLMLMVTRGSMGIGGAAIMPSTLSILTNVYTDSRERARAIGIWSGTAGLGVAVGPVAGGWLLAHFWWGSVFLLNVPVALVGAAVALWLIPESRNPASRRPDLVGSLLSIVGIGGVLWGVIEAPGRSWTSPLVVTALGSGLVVLALFVLWERRSEHPMLPLGFFSSRRFSAAVAALGLVMLALMGALFLLTQYLQFFLGYSAYSAGWRVAPVAGTLLIAAPLSSLLVARFGTKPVVVTGLALISAGLALVSRTSLHSTYVDALPAFFFMGIGVGLALAPCIESVMGSIPATQAGVGSATNGAAQQTGGALGVGILGSLLNGRYQGHLAPLLAHYPLPGSVSAIIKGSLGGALAVAQQVGGTAGAQLASHARAAFLSGMTLALGVAAIVVAAAAMVVALLLPNRPPRA